MSRRVSWVVAGLVVLAGVVVAVLVPLSARGTFGPHLDGVAVQRLGSFGWHGAQVDTDGRTVTLLADGQPGPVSSCHRTGRLRVVEDGSQEVRLRVDGYAPRRPGHQICPAALLGPSRYRVVLPEALGARRLVDDHDGRARPVLRLADLPTVGALPRGYATAGLSWDDTTEVVLRTYTRAGGELSLAQGPSGALPVRGRVVARPDVAGRPGVLAAAQGGAVCVWWPLAPTASTASTAPAATRRLCGSALDAAALLAVARSVS